MLLRMYTALGRTRGLRPGARRAPSRRGGRHQDGHLHGARGRTSTGCSRPSAVSTAWCGSRPFDAQKRRHTSFASLDVIPLLDEASEDDIEIPTRRPADRRLPLERTGRPVREHDRLGGAHHAPARPGIPAACQNERSQLQNKAVAMRILKSRLAELARQQHDEKIENLRGERKAVDFGSQIRSYVLAPVSDGEGPSNERRDRRPRAGARRRPRPIHRGRAPPAGERHLSSGGCPPGPTERGSSSRAS